MPEQTKISSFFSKARVDLTTAAGSTSVTSENLNINKNDGSTKSLDLEATAGSKSPDDDRSSTVQSTSRKRKVSDDSSPPRKKSLPSKSILSPDEKSKIEKNKTSAKLKLLTTKTNGQIVNVGMTWFMALESELNKDYIIELCKFVSNERKKGPVYPPVDQVFTWTTACSLDSVKVVIIGQDPYHGPKQAHGLCFSVLPGIKPPPSLVNMFKELESSIDGFKHPGHGCLTGWATQGVLLLNACLTVKGGSANSHAGKGWEKLTDAVIRWINSKTSGVVFMLWGAYAQKKGSSIDKKKHHVLSAVHPSPLSAHRGFFGCGHFSRCNELLEADGKLPIDWTHLPVEH